MTRKRQMNAEKARKVDSAPGMDLTKVDVRQLGRGLDSRLDRIETEAGAYWASCR